MKYLQNWDEDMPTQISRDRVNLYRVEIVADMILDVSMPIDSIYLL